MTVATHRVGLYAPSSSVTPTASLPCSTDPTLRRADPPSSSGSSSEASDSSGSSSSDSSESSDEEESNGLSLEKVRMGLQTLTAEVVR